LFIYDRLRSRPVQVLAYDSEKLWHSASNTVSVTTYQNPHDVELLAATSSSIYVAWVSPADDSVLQHTFQYTKVSNSTVVLRASFSFLTDRLSYHLTNWLRQVAFPVSLTIS